MRKRNTAFLCLFLLALSAFGLSQFLSSPPLASSIEEMGMIAEERLQETFGIKATGSPWTDPDQVNDPTYLLKAQADEPDEPESPIRTELLDATLSGPIGAESIDSASGNFGVELINPIKR